MDKYLGKISSVSFGLGGYNDAMIGIHIRLDGEGLGTFYTKSAWDSNLIKHDERSKWTEDERSEQYSDILRYVSDLLSEAKVSSVDKLKGIPIEMTFDGMQLKDWRILTEVL